jgi:ElaB/YqjD/DUF883 family membrane-anchored ribosome-binding protein
MEDPSMPPRDPSLPEGTDHIIDTNIDLGDTGGGSGGGSGAGSTGSGAGGSGGGNSRTAGLAGQVRDQINTLKSQAGDRARSLADDGKGQATTFLQTMAQIVADAAGSVEERLGSQYSGFGHKASTSINSLASTLDERSIDDLIDDARSFVQRSPAIAIGAAALIGFAAARVLRAGIAEYSNTGDSGDSAGSTGGGTGGSTGGASGAMSRGGASGGLDATSGGFGEQGIGTAGTMGSGVSTGAGSSGGTGNAPTL